MNDAKAQPKADESKVAERGFRRAQKKLERSLGEVAVTLQSFTDKEGQRQSLIVLEKGLRAASGHGRPQEDEPLTAARIAESLIWLDALRNALAPEILEDLESEAQETGSDQAAKLLASIRRADRNLEDFREAHSGIAAYLHKEELPMPPRTDNKINIRVTTDTATGGAAATKVQAQLMSTLDSFGLPHKDGLLDSRGPDAPRLAGRLVEMLERRFDVREDPLGGMRASPRRYSISERSGSEGDEDMSGRLQIAAELAIATSRQIGLTLDDFITLAGTVDEWPLNDPARIDGARDRVERQLDVLRELAGRAGGPPTERCSYELTMIRQAIAQQLAALGLRRDATFDSDSEWGELRSSFEASLEDVLAELGVPLKEELRGLFEQLFEQAQHLDDQLTEQGNLTPSERSYHLRRILEAIATQVEATRADMEESPESAAWVGTLLDPLVTDRYLADELEEALDWLEELASTYGLSDRAYEVMRQDAVAELYGALGKLETTIAACMVRLDGLEVPDDDDVVERLNGLLQLIQSAKTLAENLSGMGPITAGSRSPKAAKSRRR